MSPEALHVEDTVAEQPLLPVRRLHNYMYCPRLFYYQWVENIFVESGDTVAGSHVHRNVDQPSPLASEEVLQDLPPGNLRSLKLESAGLGLVGVIDLLESGAQGARLVDYKKGAARRSPNGERMPKEADSMQVVAQALLLAEHGISVQHASIYYAEDKRHVPVPLTPEVFAQCHAAIGEARALARAGTCPDPLENDIRCLYCSAYPVCLPNESAFWAESRGQETRAIDTPPKPENDEGEILIVQKPGAMIGLRGEQFTISFHGETLQKAPAQQVRAIYLYGPVQLTAAAAHFCLEHTVDVAYFAASGRFLGLLRGLPASGIDARLGQYRLHAEEKIRMTLSREFIRAKIHNQRVLLMRNADNAQEAVDEMARLRDATADATDTCSLMGLEGRAAALYFRSFRSMLRTELGFDFERRNRRPPRDPVNALLSMAYSMLCKELTGVCHTVGLDPFAGFLHAPRYGRPALALDLMEEFRPIIADSVVISMINRREIGPEDFVHSSNGVFLKDDGRRSFWEAYARRMDTEIAHPVFAYKMSYRRMLEVQARQLWRLLRGEAEAYTGFTTR